jgi:hypothetical protein
MTEPQMTFFRRLGLAFVAWWRVLVDPEFAAGAARLRQDALPAPQAAPALAEAPPDAALQLLGLLQQEGRFLDFIEEEVAGFSDAEIGAAARVVHQGCHKALHEYFGIEPVRAEAEGSRVTLAEGFDAGAVRLTGNVVGSPPFTGTLVHRGWRVKQVRLPKVVRGHDVQVLAPAEVEL